MDNANITNGKGAACSVAEFVQILRQANMNGAVSGTESNDLHFFSMISVGIKGENDNAAFSVKHQGK